MIFPLDYIPAISILISLPYLCWCDWKTRTIPFSWICGIVAINSPILYMYLLESPPRNYYLLGLSGVLCLLMLAMVLLGRIGGGDFFTASAIMMYVQYNPFRFPRVCFPMDFFWTMLVCIVLCLPLVMLYNVRSGKKLGVWKEMFDFPGGIPLVIPISVAFVSTLIMELIPVTI